MSKNTFRTVWDAKERVVNIYGHEAVAVVARGLGKVMENNRLPQSSRATIGRLLDANNMGVLDAAIPDMLRVSDHVEHGISGYPKEFTQLELVIAAVGLSQAEALGRGVTAPGVYEQAGALLLSLLSLKYD